MLKEPNLDLDKWEDTLWSQIDPRVGTQASSEDTDVLILYSLSSAVPQQAARPTIY